VRAAILSTGDELTTGRTLDTNANFIADQLIGVGIDVAAIVVVGDYPERIEWAWQMAFEQAEVVLSTGGLGPTADDLTTETVGRLARRRLLLDQSVADRIRKMFEAMGRVMPENNLKQAMFPEGATVIPNALGTAPGFRLEIETAHGPRHGVVLPGVPREMKAMLAQEVLPWLRHVRGGTDVYRSHVFQTFGISESALDELVAGAVDPAVARVAFRAAFPQISVRLTVHGPPDQVEARLAGAAAGVRARIAPYCYGEGETTMEAVVGEALRRDGATIAVAESCTGGLIGHRLTDVPGSSAYVLGDVVAYGNAVKTSVLGVRPQTLDACGAVSCEVAEEMAAGVRVLTGATVGLATTGIAGPDGGTPDKPVGTVCLGLATAERRYSRRYQLWGTREWIKLLTSQIALDWVRRIQNGEDPTASAILRK
jgi:competence/damage-inducible protein CinA-like protein